MTRFYLDHAATTPVRPEVREAMLPWLATTGNPSSLHAEGRRARAAIDRAREALAAALGAEFGEVLFTSGGTEAANALLVGMALAHPDPNRRRVLISAAEHHCVLHAAKTLVRLGYRVETVPVDRMARVDLAALETMLADDVLLVAVMHANNELGTLQPVEAVAELARSHGARFVCDAVQTFGTLDLRHLDADGVIVSAHKIGGPPGVGAMRLRAGVDCEPLIQGGGQEREMRAGTENLSGIIGFGVATELAVARRDERVSALRAQRDAFWAHLAREAPTPVATVPGFEGTLPGHCHLRYPGLPAETMLIRLDREGVSASSGAACSSGSLEPSHVLLACGYSPAEAGEGLRFTFGGDPDLDPAAAAAKVAAVAAAMGRMRTPATA